jgi:hypothetical protein
MNLRVFSHRQFAMGSIVAFIYGTALFGSTYLLPVYLQLGLQLSASHVGAHPAALGLCAGPHDCRRRPAGRPATHATCWSASGWRCWPRRLR